MKPRGTTKTQRSNAYGMTSFGPTAMVVAAVVAACGCLNQRVEMGRAVEQRVEAGSLTNLIASFDKGIVDETIPGPPEGQRGNCDLIDTNGFGTAIRYPYEVWIVCQTEGDSNTVYRYQFIKDSAIVSWRLQSATKENKVSGEKVNLLRR